VSEYEAMTHEANAAAHEVVKKLRHLRKIDAELDDALCACNEARAKALTRRLGFAQSALDRTVEAFEDVERRSLGVATL
jgi:UDP-N-acetylmuramate-alanine ligase